MKKKVLGKGLSALIKENKTPADENKRKENNDSQNFSENIKEKTVSEPVQAEPAQKKVFFNPKTGAYEEREVEEKASYKTQEMPVVTGRRTTKPVQRIFTEQKSFSSEKQPVKKVASESLKPTSPTTPGKKNTPGASVDQNIKQQIRKEVDASFNMMNNILKGEIAKLKYLEKKLFEKPGTEVLVSRQELIDKIDSFKKDFLKEINTVKKEIESFETRQNETDEKIRQLRQKADELAGLKGGLSKIADKLEDKITRKVGELLREKDGSIPDIKEIVPQLEEKIEAEIMNISGKVTNSIFDTPEFQERIKQMGKQIRKDIKKDVDDVKKIMLDVSRRLSDKEKQLEKDRQEIHEMKKYMKVLKETLR